MPLPTSWCLAPGQRLLHRCWDGECVLYNDLTGDTHLVDEFALEVLVLLRTAPMPASLLAASLNDVLADAPLDEAIDAILADLAALHLVEAAPC